MTSVNAFDAHADLRAEMSKLKRDLMILEERVWRLADALYRHDHLEMKP